MIVVNFPLSLRLGKVTGIRKNRMFAIIISLNIIILAFFKYFNIIFPDNQLSLFNVDFFYRVDPIEKMILPLGLSYLTFSLLSYHIEINRETIFPEKHLGYFSLYLLFFPKITQGPIERPQHFITQLKNPIAFNYFMLTNGLKLILWGYFKKLVVADRLAIYVNAVYNNSEHHNGTTLFVATIFFAFQIYADFSGYTDIALGSAKMFGINLTDNFKRPYLATSIQDFWNRWHITFSTWLRDYIFLPTAFSMTKKMQKPFFLHIASDKWIYFISIIVTFAICGIWHGVGWTYLVWGLLFGIFLAFSNWTKEWRKKVKKDLKLRKGSSLYIIYSITLTFILVSFAWIFFRAPSLTNAIKIIKSIFTTSGPVFYESPAYFIFSVLGILVLIFSDIKREYFNKNLSVLYNKSQLIRISGIVIIVIIILLVGVFDGGQFIYFQY